MAGKGEIVMKALITGGAGFIGYHQANELLKEGYKVVLIDNFARGVQDSFLGELEQNPQVTLMSMDIMERQNLLELDNDFDYIYHFAAIIGVQNVLEHPYDVLRINIELLFNMIDFAKKQKRLKCFIFASTSEVYAGTLQYYNMVIPTPESTALTVSALEHPRTSYMLSKIYGEAVMQQSGLPFVIIRPHNFYGPRMGMSHVIPELLKKAYFANDGQMLEVFSVEHKRTFCYISDAVRMIRLIAEKEEAKGQTFNIGNEMPEISIREVAQLILKIVGKVLDIDEKSAAVIGSPIRRCPDMKKAYALIDYIGQVSLEDGIRETFEWYKKHVFEGNEVSAK